jgi:translocation and assembly module TamB
VHLTGEHALDLRSRGRVNLKLLQAFNPNLVAYGPATFTVNVTGNSARPQLSGRLELNDASVSFVDLPNGLSHISGSLVFAQDRMQVEKLTAHTGGGELNVGVLPPMPRYATPARRRVRCSPATLWSTALA